MKDYPNFLQLENTTVNQILSFHNEYLGKPYKKSIRHFSQMWPNTATGFDDIGVISGQAFTEGYTTVIKIDFGINKDGSRADFYGVFFDGAPGYLIFNPTKQFYKDLDNEHMKTRGEAKKLY